VTWSYYLNFFVRLLERNYNKLVILTKFLNQQSMNHDDAIAFERRSRKRADHASAKFVTDRQ